MKIFLTGVCCLVNGIPLFSMNHPSKLLIDLAVLTEDSHITVANGGTA